MSQQPTFWPALPASEWADTMVTLHMWTQIVGKIRLAQTPLVNHWWNVPLYVTARGLTTSAMPYAERNFQIDFDFINHQLIISCSDGAERRLGLVPRSVAAFYREVMALLGQLGISVKIWPVPVELEHPIPFAEDEQHASYDPAAAQRFWRSLTLIAPVLESFRGQFIGKCSPVHFFWGSFDLAVTRFSGRLAPPREGADSITVEAYSHEVISHGFWPGGNGQEAAFYAYSAPPPAGFAEASVQPAEAYYNAELGEFLLPYEAVRRVPDPAEHLRQFLQSTYDAGATLGHWDRALLER
ncbi:hypothetical protein HMJ29_14975 [Hymenobacter taeanensis]|uniref:Ava_C0101 and related proteins n=1 Tax=Hymenobacter taeanensis TaxID=2735321 RepID=A0A6M6BJK5_9BACT|nr:MULTISPECIES: DUF5996 family protein [Hymenobacter]QJX48159.1 hypothetical protein HMJ29_14975 [Hymenobacter taeanensis]UOQ82367.1 DUF5996 family protein [Hymenobacter sp. 5414T-23]